MRLIILLTDQVQNNDVRTSTAILDAIKDTRRALKGESQGVYYVEDMLKEIKQLNNEENVFEKLCIEDGVIKLI